MLNHMWKNKCIKDAFQMLLLTPLEQWNIIDHPFLPKSKQINTENLYMFSIKRKRFGLRKNFPINRKDVITWNLLRITAKKTHALGIIQTPVIACKKDLFQHLADLFEIEQQHRLQHHMQAIQGLCGLFQPDYSFGHIHNKDLWVQSKTGEEHRFVFLHEKEMDLVLHQLKNTAYPSTQGMISNQGSIFIEPLNTAHEKIHALEKAHEMFPKTIHKLQRIPIQIEK